MLGAEDGMIGMYRTYSRGLIDDRTFENSGMNSKWDGKAAEEYLGIAAIKGVGAHPMTDRSRDRKAKEFYTEPLCQTVLKPFWTLMSVKMVPLRLLVWRHVTTCKS